MAYLYDVPNITTGMDDFLIGLGTEVPIFIPMMLLFVWGIVFLGGMFAQKSRTGSADMPMWAVIACLSTLLATLPLTITAGIINLEILVIEVVLTIFAGFWLFMDRNKNEI